MFLLPCLLPGLASSWWPVLSVLNSTHSVTRVGHVATAPAGFLSLLASTSRRKGNYHLGTPTASLLGDTPANVSSKGALLAMSKKPPKASYPWPSQRPIRAPPRIVIPRYR